MRKSIKSIMATAFAVVAISSVSVVPVCAMFDNDVSTSSSSVIDAYTFNAKVTRVANGALQVEPDASANLGSKVAITFADAMNFKAGDTVTVTYSGSVGESNGMKTLAADKIVKVDTGTSAEPISVDDKTTNTDTTKPDTTKTETPKKDTTPATGDKGVATMATIAVLSGGTFGAYTLLKRKD